MRSSKKQHGKVIIEDVLNADLLGEYSDASDFEEMDQNNYNAHLSDSKQTHHCALSSYQGETKTLAAQQLDEKLKGQTKTTDDSASSFLPHADNMGSNFSAPQPSAPPMDPDEYTAYLNAYTLAQRESFNEHRNWAHKLGAIGNKPGLNPVINESDMPRDVISERLINAVYEARNNQNANVNLRHLLHGRHAPDGFNNITTYQPQPYREVPMNNNYHDGIQQRINWSADGASKRTTRWWQGWAIRPNQMYVLSDHNGGSHGTNYEIWGPGTYPPLATFTNPNLGILQENQNPIPLNTQFHHVPGRCTVVQINQNEIGLCQHVGTNDIQKLETGRYFIEEQRVRYLGKARLEPGVTRPFTPATTDSNTRNLIDNFRVTLLQQGQIAFVDNNSGTFIVDEPGVFITDNRNNERVLNLASRNDRICAAADNSYHIITLQPGEYTAFRDLSSQDIVWKHNTERPELNRIHLNTLAHQYCGNVYNKQQGSQVINSTIVLFNRSNYATAVMNPQGDVQFFETSNQKAIVLRQPWQWLREFHQNDNNVIINDADNAPQVERIMLNNAQWAVTQKQNGKIEILPPLLNGRPYYLYRPYYTFSDVLNCNTPGIQTVSVPAFGDVTLANLSSGQIGCCTAKNVNFFLNPRPNNPQLFIAPDVFTGIMENDNPHVTSGDLHRVYIKPNERACVEVDGRPILLPDSDSKLSKESRGDGIYIFRARQNFRLIGPIKKTEKRYKLGNYEYFTVEAGEVAYGSKNGRLKVWDELGEHRINISEGERFKDFFRTSVDPVEVKNFPVVCKHSITSHLDFGVSYSLIEASSAIERHNGDHSSLHDFVARIASSILVSLCATRPPLGYSESDFDAVNSTRTSTNNGNGDKEETKLDLVRNEFEDRLKKHEEINNANIDISFANITKWEVDEEFLSASKKNAQQLLAAHAESEIAKMDLETQRIKQAQGQQQREAEIQQEKLNLQRQQLILQAKNSAALSEAEQISQKEVIAAKAKASAETVTKQALVNQNKIEAEAALVIAEKQKLLRTVEAETRCIEAEAKARSEASASTAKSVAEAKAEKESAQLYLDAAKIKTEAATLEAQAKITTAQADAQKAVLIKQAEFPGLKGESLANCILQREMIALYAKNLAGQQVITHTLDPQQGRQFQEEQLQKMLWMMQSMGMSDPRQFAASQRSTNSEQAMNSLLSSSGLTSLMGLFQPYQDMNSGNGPNSGLQKNTHGHKGEM